ncbi:SIMPL domain-containing protein [Pseudoalteromonas sp. S409]|nr:hypothetical protein ATS71_05740 [Pseudoalteromonas sp. H71]TMN80727.1 SIMPL domain-containing protein [Pseudoalteromonas sp. S410]TMN89684.1 SIMPL domain-containing protein [Pseudoalteromonas sp. S408]TMN97297.1 SIMPL domain-containing protein [Pseudoalteromonas sp. S407]TMO02305.1 SIMPL domain-containing protein [Pseudoalteromonas sp. S409]TMO11980.1 SIMPL domain-containing protein [Pseudoalteromonas sp. S186]TMO16564.1 SIMPL domain-containing protein [Pseudoalteromonas sp. S185]
MTIALLFTLSASAETELKGSPKELKSFLHPEVKTISITESAEEIAFKDEAVLSLLVTTEDDKLAISLSKNAKVRADISSALTANKIPLENIKNSKFSTSPDYGWFGNKPDSYKVANTVTVVINNETGLQSIAKIVDSYDEVTLISTEYRHSEKELYKQKVKEKALNKVLKQKEFYAKSLGLKLKPISFTNQASFANDDIERIVVTGSRVKRSDYSSVNSEERSQTSFEKITYSTNVTVQFIVE